MKSRILSYITAMTVFAAQLPSIRLAAQGRKKQAHYSVKDLGTLDGTGAVAEAARNRGWVFGSANLAGRRS
jgi:hypothetical protein